MDSQGMEFVSAEMRFWVLSVILTSGPQAGPPLLVSRSNPLPLGVGRDPEGLGLV